MQHHVPFAGDSPFLILAAFGGKHRLHHVESLAVDHIAVAEIKRRFAVRHAGHIAMIHSGHTTVPCLAHVAMIHAHAGHRLVAVALHQGLHTELIQRGIHHQLQPALLHAVTRGQGRQRHQRVGQRCYPRRLGGLNTQHRQRLIERRQRHPHLFDRQRDDVKRLTIRSIHQHFKTLAHQYRQFMQLDRLIEKTTIAGYHIQRAVIAGGQPQ